MTDTQEKKERAILAGLSAASMDVHDRSTEVSMDELGALVETAGGEVVAMIMQNRPTPDPRSFLGDGKVQEMKALIEMNDCDLAVFDNELSPSQMQALSDDLGIKVLDRSGLILDIFAQRAQTKEGQLQVELAQYKYLLPRLTGMWTHLVRQTASGGSSPIGTRGPGETQLETDRRHIRRKIQKLEEELAQVRKVRDTQRRQREKNAIPVIALVGYTNAGKSTLLNCLTDSDIPANNRIFDTLDTTTRRFSLDGTKDILVSDTVGFIRKLPTHLIEAFKATLEELKYADVLLHVIDISNPEWQEQARVVDSLIRELGAEQTPCIRVYNKCDSYRGILPHGENTVCISARTGEGTAELCDLLKDILHIGKRGSATMGEFTVPSGAGESEYEEKRSRFLGHVRRVDTEEEARAFIDEIKKKYHDARHNCWCYIINNGPERYSDDGEPQGTAGIPMLEVFRKEGVSNVICVVTRYFGGTLLGAGGLLRAYTKAAKDALDSAGKEQLRATVDGEIVSPYSSAERFKAEIGSYGGELTEIVYEADVTLRFTIPISNFDDFAAHIFNISSGKIIVQKK